MNTPFAHSITFARCFSSLKPNSPFILSLFASVTPPPPPLPPPFPQTAYISRVLHATKPMKNGRQQERMTASINCELVFVYENVSAGIAEQRHLTFASPTPVTATIDGAFLCFQHVQMRRELAAEDSLAHPPSHSQHGDRRASTALPSATSVLSVRVREQSAFSGQVLSTRAAYKPEVVVYRVPLADVSDTDLQLDPVNADQAEKPFGVVLYTTHVEARTGLSVAAMELQNIPYNAIASFYGKLQKKLTASTPHSETPADDGLVRSRSVSQQQQQTQREARPGSTHRTDALPGQSRYAFLHNSSTAAEKRAQAVGTEVNAELESARSNDRAATRDAQPQPPSRYDFLAAIGGARPEAPHPQWGTKAGTTPTTTGGAGPIAILANTATTIHGTKPDPPEQMGVSAAGTLELPAGGMLPGWFPSWDHFEPSANPVRQELLAMRQACGLATAESTEPAAERGANADGDVTEEASTLARTARQGEAAAPADAGFSSLAGVPSQSMAWQRELHTLKELRDRTNELEQARVALDAFRAAMVAKEAERDAQDAALMEQFPHLTAAQRLLVDFDRLLLPLPGVEAAAAAGHESGGTVQRAHVDPHLLIRSAVLDLASRSLGVRDAGNETPSVAAVPTKLPRASLVLRAHHSQPCSPVTAARPKGDGFSQLCTPAGTTAASGGGLASRLPIVPSFSDVSTHSSVPTRSSQRPGSPGLTTHGMHTHAPLVAPTSPPPLRHRQHNEASTVPTAPAPVAMSSAESSSVPVSPLTDRLVSTDSVLLQGHPDATAAAMSRRAASLFNTPTQLKPAAQGARVAGSAVVQPSLTSSPGTPTLVPSTATSHSSHAGTRHAHHGKHSHVPNSSAGSDVRQQSPPLTMANTMPPNEPEFLLDQAGSHSMAT